MGVVGPTSKTNRDRGMSNALAASIMSRVATEDMNANELMEAIGDAIGMSGDWDIDIFDNIKATDMVQAYKDGILPSTYDAMNAISRGEYIGDKNDYMNEVLSDIFGLDYGKETGFVSKGAKPKEKIPSISQERLDEIIGSEYSGAHVNTVFGVGGTSYTYNPNTGKITRNSDGQVVNGIDDINAYAKEKVELANASGSSGTSPITGGTGVSESNDNVDDASSGIPYVPGSSAGGSGASGSSGGYTGGAPYNPGGNAFSGGYPASGGSGTGSAVGGGSGTGFIASGGTGTGKSGADVLADYLSSLSIDSDFSKNLNASRENLESKYGTLFEDIRTGDYTKKPYYQTILDSYGIAGDAAADDASASGAAANSGNLDSYAAANARRQQLAYKNAAQNAALNAYNTDIGNMLKTLSDLGVNVNDLYATWAGELDSQRGNAVNAYLGQIGADTDRYVSDNALAGDKYQSDTDRYLGELGLEGTKYQTDAEKQIASSQTALDKYIADLNAEMNKYNTDASVQMNTDSNAAKKELAQLENEYNATMAELERKHELLMQEKSTASAERIAQIDKEIREIEATKAEATEKYKTDKALEESKYLADKEANSYLEGLKYNTTTGGEIEVKDPTTEEYNKALEIYRTQGSSALDKYIDSLARGKQDLVRNYVEKHAATISNDDLYTIAAYANYAMKQGGRGYSDATKEAWVDYVAKKPEMNTDQNKDFVMEYLDKTFATN